MIRGRIHKAFLLDAQIINHTNHRHYIKGIFCYQKREFTALLPYDYKIFHEIKHKNYYDLKIRVNHKGLFFIEKMELTSKNIEND